MQHLTVAEGIVWEFVHEGKGVDFVDGWGNSIC